MLDHDADATADMRREGPAPPAEIVDRVGHDRVRGALAVYPEPELALGFILLESVFLFEPPPAELDAEAGPDIEPVVESLGGTAAGSTEFLVLEVGPAALRAGVPDCRPGRADEPLRLRLGHAQHCGERDAGTD